MIITNILYFLCISTVYMCKAQYGPDPWDRPNSDLASKIENERNIPPDLRLTGTTKKRTRSENNLGISDWFFRRMLGLVLKGGQVKKNDDETVDVSLQMKFDKDQWRVLEKYLNTDSSFSEQMLRRSVGYIQDAIYEPTITEKIVVAWSYNIQVYLMENKVHIMWTLGVLGAAGAIIWLWNRMSHKHLVIIIFMFLYLYEVFVSYKEAEQKELEIFLSAVDKCKWFFWTSACEVPPPDPMIFIKHMNPLKIGLRLFTTVISEPLLVISETIKVIFHGIADGLWFPFDKIVYGMLIVTFNIMLTFLFVMIMFNYILNIPFNLSAFGLINLGVNQRNRTLLSNSNNDQTPNRPSADRISGATLNRILDIYSHALRNPSNNPTNVPNTRQISNSDRTTGIRRTASTGRLPNYLTLSNDDFNELTAAKPPRKRNNIQRECLDGSGDAR